jgi:hypothetical protein
MLLGEATFHQIHGGIATDNFNPSCALFHEEYARLRGHAYTRPTRPPVFFGALPQAIRPCGTLNVARATFGIEP